MPLLSIGGPAVQDGALLVRALSEVTSSHIPNSGDRTLDALLAELSADLGDGIEPVGEVVVLERRAAEPGLHSGRLLVEAHPADPADGPVFALLQLRNRSMRWVTADRQGHFVLPDRIQHILAAEAPTEEWEPFGILRWFQATNNARVGTTLNAMSYLERTVRFQRLRTYTPANWTRSLRGFSNLGPSSPEWRDLAKGRVLLFIHGTLRQSHSGFGGVRSPSTLLDHELQSRFTELAARYDNRVIALDHLTVTEDPLDNVRLFLASIPPDITLDLDIIAQSRGAIVARMLSEEWGREQAGPAAQRLRVHRVVMAGAPNRGTPLVEPKRAQAFLDLHTHLAMSQPGTEGTASLKLLSGLARGVARSASLSALMPGGASLNNKVGLVSRLNEEFSSTCTDATYFVIQANYDSPDDAASSLSIEVMQEPNDLIVPVKGAFDIGAVGNGHTFPVTGGRRLLFTPQHRVNHQNYFRQLETWQMLRRWLR